MFRKTILFILAIHQAVSADPTDEDTPVYDEGPQYMIDNGDSEPPHEADMFEIYEDNMYDFNLTHEIIKDSMSCEEFVENYTFDPFKVLDIEWTTFYFWSPHVEGPFSVKFSMVPKKIRELYRKELDKEMSPRIDWDNAFLYMESSVGHNALIIKDEFNSIFYVVSSEALEYYNVQPMLFALKLVEPHGYLAMINCKYRIGSAFARTEMLPHYTQYAQEAAKIGFRSKFGHTHLDTPSRSPKSGHHNFPDIDEDEEMDFPPVFVNAR